MAIRGVLFDLGDTLVTQEALVGSPSNRQGAAQVAEALGQLTEVAPTAEQLTDPLGETLQEALIESYQGECAVPDARRAFLEVLDRFDLEPPSELIDLLLPMYFGPHYARMTVDPLAVRTLELLRRADVRTAIVGNLIHGEELLVERLRAFDLLRLVDALVLSTESGWMKPHPVAYREALRRLDVPAADAVMVGDDLEVDVRAPQALGLRAIWLRRDAPSGPASVTPDAIINDLGGLIPAIAELDAAEAPS
ncbi:MAG: HAD family hydrolase [Chloroflexi bacterium]|nr:HAD family hydrolase [Chloroflexota bacterium]